MHTYGTSGINLHSWQIVFTCSSQLKKALLGGVWFTTEAQWTQRRVFYFDRSGDADRSKGIIPEHLFPLFRGRGLKPYSIEPDLEQ